MNKYKIIDLSMSRIAVENNGTIEQLEAVLKSAFPISSKYIGGNFKYYYRSPKYPWSFTYTNCKLKRLPKVCVADLYQTLEPNKNIEMFPIY